MIWGGTHIKFKLNRIMPGVYCCRNDADEHCPQDLQVLQYCQGDAVHYDAVRGNSRVQCNTVSVLANPSVTLLMQEVQGEVFNHCEGDNSHPEEQVYVKERCLRAHLFLSNHLHQLDLDEP